MRSEDDLTKFRRQKRQFKEMQLMGLTNISRALGWDNNRTSIYIKRGIIPAPIGEVGGRPVWLGMQILPYVEEWQRNYGPKRRRNQSENEGIQ